MAAAPVASAAGGSAPKAASWPTVGGLPHRTKSTAHPRRSGDVTPATSAAQLCSSQIAVNIASNSQFNMGTGVNPSGCVPQDGGWDLMFQWPSDPWSSFATVRIDGADAYYGGEGTELQAPTTSGAANTTVWQFGDIKVTQRLEIVPNDVNGKPDVVEISYTAQNVGSTSHTVGLRSMIDTELDYNDGATFRADGAGQITTERTFTGPQVPAKLQTYYSASDLTHVGTVTLRQSGAPAPDRVVIAKWPSIDLTSWDYATDSSASITGDSAFATYWNPTTMAAGGSRTYQFSYGLGPRQAATGSTGAVSPSSGPWYGGNRVRISVPGLPPTPSATVDLGGSELQPVGQDDGWVDVVIPRSYVDPQLGVSATPHSANVDVWIGSTHYLHLESGYTYRGIAIVFLRGINSEYDPAEARSGDAFDSKVSDGLYQRLLGYGFSKASIHQFSYAGLGPQGQPLGFNCTKTFDSPTNDLANLDGQLKQIAATDRNVDIFLVGHSKGGLLALTYLAWLAKTQGAGDMAIRGAGGIGHLAGVATLDSPLGGTPLSGSIAINTIAELCAASKLSPVNPALAAFTMLLWGAHLNAAPYGGTASVSLLLGSPALGSNQALAESASSQVVQPAGPAVLTIGNAKDAYWATGLIGPSGLVQTSPVLDAASTQWMDDAGLPARVFQRQISSSWTEVHLDWHGLMLRQAQVGQAVAQLLSGKTPSSITWNGAVSGILNANPASVVTTGIGGTVTGPGNEPLAGVTVAVRRLEPEFVDYTTTGSDGGYSFALDPGNYQVAVFDDTAAHASGFVAPVGLVPTEEGASSFAVDASPLIVDVHLPAAHVITGAITTAGAPAAGYFVEAANTAGTALARTQAAPDGSYQLAVPAGSYLIRARGDGTTYAAGYYSAGGYVPFAADADAVDATGAPQAGVDIDLPSIAHVYGTVTDYWGQPLSNAAVTAIPTAGAGLYVAMTDGDGNYALPIDPGNYVVQVVDLAGNHVAGYYSDGGWVAESGSATAVGVGLSDLYDVSVSMPSPSLPGAPTAVTAVVDSANALFVSWAPPANTGGGAIQNYHVVSSPGGLECTSYGPTDCVVYGLAPGTDYAFTVTATNAAGAGPASDASTPLTAVGVPGMPQGPSAIAGSASAVVSWAAPDSDGGSSITGYTATSFPDGLTCMTAAAVTSCEINGLTNGTSYTFTVTATNQYGEGQASDATTPVVPLSVPGKPTGVAADAGDAQATVWWSAPADDGGAPIDAYRVTSTPGGLQCDPVPATGTSCLVIGLANGTSYTFTAQAHNSQGWGAASDASLPVTPSATIPATPSIGALPTFVTSPTFAISWSATPGTNPVASYDVVYRRALWSGGFGAYTPLLSGSASTTAKVTATKGSTYCFAVRARDTIGTLSAWTPEVCTGVPLDDRALTRSSGWTAGTGSAYYAGTYLRTSRVGQTLKKTNVFAKRVAILATTCPTCGSIRVYWNGVLVKTISLRSSMTVNRKVINVVTFSVVKKGTLLIKVSSSAKKVLVDGVGLRR